MRVQLWAAGAAQARPLLDALALRGLPAEVADVTTLALDFGVRRRMDTVVNLAGSHPDPAVRLLIADALAWLGDIGAGVVNGLDAFVVSSSPARQVALLEHLGLPHPAARVLASPGRLPAALAELGEPEERVEVLAGPPPVARVRPLGELVRLELVAGRPVAGDAGLPEAVAAAAAEVLGTAGIEFGGVTLAVDGGDVQWLGVDGEAPRSAAGVGALAEHVAFRAGLATSPG